MGSFTLTGNITAPKQVREFGDVIAGCESIAQVHLAQIKHDIHARREIVISAGKNGRFMAEVRWDKKKYPLGVTPYANVHFGDCGVAVVHALRAHDPSVRISGDEIFIPRRTSVPLDAAGATVRRPAAAGSDGGLETSPAPVLLQLENPSIWEDPRVLATYHFARQYLLDGKPGATLIDETQGTIINFGREMETYFTASGGTLDRPLKILKGAGVFVLEMVTTPTRLFKWTIHFVQGVPEIAQEPKALWDTTSRQKRSAARHQETSSAPTPPPPEPMPTPAAMPAPNLQGLDTLALAERLAQIAALQASVRRDAVHTMNVLRSRATMFAEEFGTEVDSLLTVFKPYLQEEEIQQMESAVVRLRSVAADLQGGDVNQ